MRIAGLILLAPMLGVLTSSCSSSSGGGTAGGDGSGGGYCSMVHPTSGDCPNGSQKEECVCIDGSLPCFGLDENTCESHFAKNDFPHSFCEPIYGFDNPNGAGDMIYIGCHTVDPKGIYTQAATCTHLMGTTGSCAWANDSDIPDGWVRCGGGGC